jgi:hypothetical protein
MESEDDRVYKSPQLVPILRQMHLVHIFPPYFPKILLILSSHLRLDLSRGLFPSRFSIKISYVILISGYGPVHLILLDLITIIYGGLIFKVLERRPRTEESELNGSKHSKNLIC